MYTYTKTEESVNNIAYALKETHLFPRITVCNFEDPDQLTIDFEEPLTQEQALYLDSFVVNYDWSLWEAKRLAMSVIDEKTRRLISKGFIASDHHFSLSEAAQRNLFSARANLENGSMSFPYEVSTDDGSIGLVVTSLVEFDYIYQAAVSRINECVGSGRSLKKQIQNATDVDGVAAVVDDRT